jgi:hypothetical protein
MILTQEEARLWGEILIGFSQGKEYVYPHTYDKDFNVVAKDFFKGSSAYISCMGSSVLICDTNEGSKAVVVGE